jgi:aminopeptidase N
VGENFEAHVYYQGNPTRDASGFGGLVTESGYIYNLGIGISANPHNYGRGWFPCFDNFKERSTYEISMKHSSSLNAHAVGTEISIIDNGDGTTTTNYAMDQEITTYQTSIAIADYHTMWSTHDGAFGPVDIKLMAKPQDSTAMKGSMGNLPAAIDCIESWYGAQPWERVAYVATTVGAMEHPTHIAYPISSINGDAESNNRLMAHELTHYWFGNLVTLSTERDMWIKEGPSEYGAHLTTECLYGKDEFLEQVKSNHKYVLDRAHVDDEIFRSLTDMPNEFTYGTHTYRKGASVIHNLRGYLGDTLFSIGMKSILDEYAYSHLDAVKFRDQLTLSTGKDMAPFFDAWINNPGFSVFVEDSLKTEDLGNGLFETQIYAQQKLYGGDFYHTEVPISLHLFGYNGEEELQMVELSGQYDELTVNTGFDVKRIVFNRDNLLNQARMADELIISEPGLYTFARTNISFEMISVSEEQNIRVEHVFGPPENNTVEGDFELNTKHYWRVIGDFSGEYNMGLRFTYDGRFNNDLDYPLTAVSEDSILLFYRPDPSIAWEPVDAELFKGIPVDGTGTLLWENALPGDYTIGKGINDVSSVNSTNIEVSQMYPNPASDELFIHYDGFYDGSVSIIDLQGRSFLKKEFDNQNTVQLLTQDIPSGQYFIEIINKTNSVKTTKKLIIIK